MKINRIFFGLLFSFSLLALSHCDKKRTEPLTHIESDPVKAEVYLDKKFIGYTPFDYKIPAGKHLVRIRKSGFFVFARELDQPTANLYALLEPLTEAVLLDIYPPAEKIFLDGEPLNSLSNQMEVGSHELFVWRNGFPLVRTNFEVKVGALSKLAIRLSVHPQGGHISFRSSPPSAKLEIDGYSLGITPFELYGLDPSKPLSVVISAKNFQEQKRLVPILPKQKTISAFALTNWNHAILLIADVPPKSFLSLKGVSLANTFNIKKGMALPLPPGEYEVVCRASGYLAHRKTILLAPQSVYELDPELHRRFELTPPAWLDRALGEKLHATTSLVFREGELFFVDDGVLYVHTRSGDVKKLNDEMPWVGVSPSSNRNYYLTTQKELWVWNELSGIKKKISPDGTFKSLSFVSESSNGLFLVDRQADRLWWMKEDLIRSWSNTSFSNVYLPKFQLVQGILKNESSGEMIFTERSGESFLDITPEGRSRVLDHNRGETRLLRPRGIARNSQMIVVVDEAKLVIRFYDLSFFPVLDLYLAPEWGVPGLAALSEESLYLVFDRHKIARFDMKAISQTKP